MVLQAKTPWIKYPVALIKLIHNREAEGLSKYFSAKNKERHIKKNRINSLMNCFPSA